jgi:TolB-like protein
MNAGDKSKTSITRRWNARRTPVLDSRYQRSGDKLRFTLRLLRVADGSTLWADTLRRVGLTP